MQLTPEQEVELAKAIESKANQALRGIQVPTSVPKIEPKTEEQEVAQLLSSLGQEINSRMAFRDYR